MAINIKNERVSQLAVALAEQTGESITEAVGKAIEERLERLTKKKSREGLADRLRVIADDIASRTTDEWRTWNWEADLYDEQTGLPK